MSEDGLEMTWHINFLSNMLLWLLLLQRIDAQDELVTRTSQYKTRAIWCNETWHNSFAPAVSMILATTSWRRIRMLDTQHCFPARKFSPKADGVVLKRIPASIRGSVDTGPAKLCAMMLWHDDCLCFLYPSFLLSLVNELSTEYSLAAKN